ncbi:MAG: prolyl oligopeptidase family serine peptidase [Planctomycetaceae bacterium]
MRQSAEITRRELFDWSLAAGAACLLSRRVPAQEGAKQPAAREALHRFPRMVQEFFVQQAAQAERVGLERRAALKTRGDAQRYVEWIRGRIQESIGPWPAKTPLNPRITGIIDRETYHIEKVVFESRPQFYVTANLYVPRGRNFPRPGVVGSCGHSSNGKAAPTYQSFAQGLARQGFVVLIFDPIGQGERLQYPDDHQQSRVGAGVGEHLLGGNQQFLVGEFFGSWRAWDGIRALDYLLTRPEVDPRHVGITGNSGGGTMTTWLAGVEPRWTMAAPSCFVTTFRRNLENELPADTEQCPPKVLSLGLDHADFLAALAPKPVIILAQERDYFDVRGSEEAFARLKALYTLLGAPDNVRLFVGPQEHGYSVENRTAMYRFFQHAVGGLIPEVEPELVVENDKTLECLPRGQVADIPSQTIFGFTKSKSEALKTARPTLSTEALSAILTGLLKLPPRNGPPRYRIFRPLAGRAYPRMHVTQYGIETEPGILALVTRLSDRPHLSRPARDTKKCLLYVSHHSADAEMRSDLWLRELIQAEPESTFYAVDLRGIGDSQPDTCGADTFLKPYGSDYFYAAHAIMLDRPYPGMRTHDLLTVLDWLKDLGSAEIHLVAQGWGTIPATFAAVLSPHVTRVTLKHALTSYAEIAETEEYRWPLSSFVPGILGQCDLPDCYRVLEEKGLGQIEPWGPSQGG